MRTLWTSILAVGLALTVATPAASAPETTGAGAPAVVVPAATDAERAAVIAYVTLVYNDLFDRNPDPTGLDAWTTQLLQGTPYGAVANGITYSDEYRSRLIAETYWHYLGRGADPAGLASWLEAMRTGVQIEDIQAGFVSSPEFYAKHGGTSAGFVAGLYQTVLGRDPAAAEVDTWVSELNRGAPHRQIARGFLYSSEHLGWVVEGYYVHLLGRHLDAVGRAEWVGLIQSGHRDEEIIAGIVASAEYRSKRQEPATTQIGPIAKSTYLSGRSLSADGRWVAFESLAAPGSGSSDWSGISAWDRTTGVTTRVSVGVDGGLPNGASWHPSISADGRWLVFVSDASNLVPGDTNEHSDLFLWDRTTGRTSVLAPQVGAGSSGFFDPVISGDGRWIAFADTYRIYVMDRLDGTTTLVSAVPEGMATGHSSAPAISADGRWITYQSDGMSLTQPDDDSYLDVFLWSRETGETTMLSADTDTEDVHLGASISADGRWIAYASGTMDNFFPSTKVVVLDRTTGTSTTLQATDAALSGYDVPEAPSLSADGRWIVYQTGFAVVVADMATGRSSQVATGPGGQPANSYSQAPVISADGRWVIYESNATNLADGAVDGTVSNLFISRNPPRPR